MSESSMSALRMAVAGRNLAAVRLLLPHLVPHVELLMVAGTAGVHSTPGGAQWAASLASARPWETPSVADSTLLVEAGRLLHRVESFGRLWRVAEWFRPPVLALDGAQ